MSDSIFDFYEADAKKACRRASSLEAKIEELAYRDPRAMRMLLYIRLSKRASEDADRALRALGNATLNKNL